MSIFHVAYYSFLRILRDKGSLFQMLVMPMVLILILGTALNSVFSPQAIEEVPLPFFDEEHGVTSGPLREFLKREGISQFFEVVPVETYQEGIDMLENDSAPVMLHLGSNGAVRLVSSQASSLRLSLLENIMQSFMYGANTVQAFALMGSTHEEYHYEPELVEDVPISVTGKTPRAMDYYAVTMLVLILLYGALYASHGLAEDLLEPIGQRIRCTPVRNGSYLIGKSLAMVGSVFAQGVILVLLTKYAYNVHWGDNLIVVFLVCFVLALFSTVFGAFSLVVAKEPMATGAFLNAFIPVSTGIAGGYMRFASPGKFFDLIRSLTPNHWAQTALFNAMYGDSIGLSLVSVGYLALATGCLLVATTIIGRRRLA